MKSGTSVKSVKIVKNWSIAVFILMTFLLLLCKINLSGDVSVKVMLNMNTELFSQPKPQSESGPAAQDCPEHPVAKADALGRLGNQISTYVNHIALQWEYGR